jgi:hypothetical protein
MPIFIRMFTLTYSMSTILHSNLCVYSMSSFTRAFIFTRMFSSSQDSAPHTNEVTNHSTLTREDGTDVCSVPKSTGICRSCPNEYGLWLLRMVTWMFTCMVYFCLLCLYSLVCLKCSLAHFCWLYVSDSLYHLWLSLLVYLFVVCFRSDIHTSLTGEDWLLYS